MSKPIKQMVMSEISHELDGCSDLLIVDASKMDAITNNRWRTALREKQIKVLTVKNTLARRSLEAAGVTGLESLLTGPTTLVWGGEDVVALSKEITKWAKDVEALQIKGAAIEGRALGTDGVESLSKSPGRVELLGQIAGLILSPGARLAAALLGPARKIAGQVKTIADKEGE